jgi:23S rRNA (guanosine2251-2'-O)-methyltransferase
MATMIKVRNKTVMMELLKGGVKFKHIMVRDGLDKDEMTRRILSYAKNHDVPIKTAVKGKMDKRRSGKTREAIIGMLDDGNTTTLDALLNDLHDKDEFPFLLLVNRVGFASNLGVIARTAFAAGVNGIIYQDSDEQFFTEDTVHYSMGTIARIPRIKMSIFAALKQLKKEGIKTYCLQMGGKSYFKQDLTGPVAFVLGAEREGVSSNVSDHCDVTLAIPMQNSIDSLNVSASASVVMYEKVRQDFLK